MDLFGSIVIALVTFGLLVTFHEFGHFWVARRCGVKVLRFSIGFGKGLFSWHDSRGTEYVIAAIPLGGYVKMLGEVPGVRLTRAIADSVVHASTAPLRFISTFGLFCAAASLADALREKYGVEPELIASNGGVFEIEVDGAQQVKEQYPEAILISQTDAKSSDPQKREEAKKTLKSHRKNLKKLAKFLKDLGWNGNGD